MKFRLFINAAVASFLFGMWQKNVEAGCFMMVFLGFVLSVVDYAQAKMIQKKQENPKITPSEFGESKS